MNPWEASVGFQQELINQFTVNYSLKILETVAWKVGVFTFSVSKMQVFKQYTP